MSNNIETLNNDILEKDIDVSKKVDDAVEAQIKKQEDESNKEDSNKAGDNGFEAHRQEIVDRINSPEEKKEFEAIRDEINQKLFGFTDSFTKARAAALAAVQSPENMDKFKEARQEILDRVDDLAGAKSIKERVNSPEFQVAIEAIKQEAKKRFEETIIELEKPTQTIEDLVAERKVELESMMKEIKEEAQKRMESM